MSGSGGDGMTPAKSRVAKNAPEWACGWYQSALAETKLKRHQESRRAADQRRIAKRPCRPKPTAARANRISLVVQKIRPSCGTSHRASSLNVSPGSLTIGPAGLPPSLRRPVQRQADRHRRALAGLAFDRHRAVVQRHQPLDQRQAEAGAFEAPRIVVLDLHERLADPGEIVGADADAGVAHPEDAGASRTAWRRSSPGRPPA